MNTEPRTRGTGNIVPKGDGKWLCRWSDGRDVNRKRVTHSKLVRGSKRAAETFLAGVLTDRTRGDYVEPNRSKLREYAAEWLAARAADRRKPIAARTLADYRWLLDRYVLPTLGERRIESLRSHHLAAIYDDMLAEVRDARGKVTKRAVGPRTVQYVHAVLRAMLRGKVAASVFDVDRPRQERREVRALSPDEVKRFREAAKTSVHRVLFDFLLATGARPGEALALRWADVDLERGVARIERALSRPAGRYELRQHKTKGSRRMVDLDPTLARELREHRKVQSERRLALGALWQQEDLVFPGPTGGPADGRPISRQAFKTVCRRAKLPADARLYSLRHTHASLALAAGSSVHEVAANLGHTGSQLVHSTYGHALPAGRSEASRRVAEVMFGSA